MILIHSRKVDMPSKPTVADLVAGRATQTEFMAALSPAEATAAAISAAHTFMERDGESRDVAGITACTVSPNADVASVRAVLEGRAALIGAA